MDIISDLINKMLDLNDSHRKKFAAIAGFFITMFSLTRLEFKLKSLSYYLLSFNLIDLLIIIFIMWIFVYLALKLSFVRRRVNPYMNLNHLLSNSSFKLSVALFVIAIMIIFLISNRQQNYLAMKIKEYKTLKQNDLALNPESNYISSNQAKNSSYSFNTKSFVSHELYRNVSKIIFELNEKISAVIRNNNVCYNKKFEFVEPSYDLDTKSLILNETTELLDYFNKTLNILESNSIQTPANDLLLQPNILKFWKIIIKLFILSFLSLVSIYIIIRVSFWIVEKDNVYGNFYAPSNVLVNKPDEVVRENLEIQNLEEQNELNYSPGLKAQRSNYIKNTPTKSAVNRYSLKKRGGLNSPILEHKINDSNSNENKQLQDIAEAKNDDDDDYKFNTVFMSESSLTGNMLTTLLNCLFFNDLKSDLDKTFHDINTESFNKIIEYLVKQDMVSRIFFLLSFYSKQNAVNSILALKYQLLMKK